MNNLLKIIISFSLFLFGTLPNLEANNNNNNMEEKKKKKKKSKKIKGKAGKGKKTGWGKWKSKWKKKTSE